MVFFLVDRPQLKGSSIFFRDEKQDGRHNESLTMVVSCHALLCVELRFGAS